LELKTETPLLPSWVILDKESTFVPNICEGGSRTGLIHTC
jgi:hypothetical protein